MNFADCVRFIAPHVLNGQTWFQDDEKEERILLPEEVSISEVYMDGDRDTTIQCLDESEVPAALKPAVITGRSPDQWQSR